MRLLSIVSFLLLLILRVRCEESSLNTTDISVTESTTTPDVTPNVTEVPIIPEVIEDSEPESSRLISQNFDSGPYGQNKRWSADNEEKMDELRKEDANLPSHLRGFHDLLFMKEVTKENERRSTLDLGSATPNQNLIRKSINTGKFGTSNFESNEPDDGIVMNDFPGMGNNFPFSQNMNLLMEQQRMMNPDVEDQTKERRAIMINPHLGPRPAQISSLDQPDPLSSPAPPGILQPVMPRVRQLLPLSAVNRLRTNNNALMNMRRTPEMTPPLVPNGVGSHVSAQPEMRRQFNPSPANGGEQQPLTSRNLNEDQQEVRVTNDMGRGHPRLFKTVHTPNNGQSSDSEENPNRRQVPVGMSQSVNPNQGGMRMSPLEQARMMQNMANARRSFLERQQEIERRMRGEIGGGPQKPEAARDVEGTIRGGEHPQQRSSPPEPASPPAPLVSQQQASIPPSMLFHMANRNTMQPILRMIDGRGLPVMMLPIPPPAAIDRRESSVPMVSPWSRKADGRELSSRAVSEDDEELDTNDELEFDGLIKKPVADDTVHNLFEFAPTAAEMSCHSKDCGLSSDPSRSGKLKKTNKVEAVTTEAPTTSTPAPIIIPDPDIVVGLQEENSKLLDLLRDQRLQQEALLRTQAEQERRAQEQSAMAEELNRFKEELLAAHQKLQQQQLDIAKQLQEQTALFNKQTEQQLQNQVVNQQQQLQHFASQQQQLQQFANQQQQFMNQQNQPQNMAFHPQQQQPDSVLQQQQQSNAMLLQQQQQQQQQQNMMLQQQHLQAQNPMINPMALQDPQLFGEIPEVEQPNFANIEVGHDEEQPMSVGVMSLERRQLARSLPRSVMTQPDHFAQDAIGNQVGFQNQMAGSIQSEQIDAICGLKDVGPVPECVANQPSWKEILRQPIDCAGDFMTRVGGGRKKREWRCFCGFFDVDE